MYSICLVHGGTYILYSVHIGLGSTVLYSCNINSHCAKYSQTLCKQTEPVTDRSQCKGIYTVCPALCTYCTVYPEQKPFSCAFSPSVTDSVSCRTLPDRPASCPYLVSNFFLGEKTTAFVTPPPRMFHHGISKGLIWLIDFEVVLKSFTMQTYFFVVRPMTSL